MDGCSLKRSRGIGLPGGKARFWLQGGLAAMEKEGAQVQMEPCQLGQLHPVAQEGLAKATG